MNLHFYYALCSKFLQPPQEPENWTSVRNATEKPPKCIQKSYFSRFTPVLSGQEDCLYLNVYTQKVCRKLSNCYLKNLIRIASYFAIFFLYNYTSFYRLIRHLSSRIGYDGSNYNFNE